MNEQSCICVWILGDQLLNAHPALQVAEKEVSRSQIRVLIIESKSRATRMQYHRKKLTLLFSAMRHYAQGLIDTGDAVDYRIDETFVDAIQHHVQEHAPSRIYTMAASE